MIGIPCIPLFPDFPLFPLPCWYCSSHLSTYINTQFFPQSKSKSHFRQTVYSYQIRDLIKKDVIGPCDCLNYIYHSLFPAILSKIPIRKRESTNTQNSCVFYLVISVNFTTVQSCCASHELERRTRWIHPTNCPVQKRLTRGISQYCFHRLIRAITCGFIGFVKRK